jgi:Short C-terminal domain
MSLIRTAAKVAVASSVHGPIQRRQQLRWAEQDQPSQAGVPADTSDRLAQLSKLGELRNAGVLTDAEFEQQKASILGQ